MNDYNTELWRVVEGFGGVFEISNYGRLKRVINSKNMPDNNLLKGEITIHGYRQYHMKVSGVSRKMKAHRLVALAFIDNPHGYKQVNHIDGNKLNNEVSNLEWCDARHNNLHALRTGLRKIDMNQVKEMHRTMAIKQSKVVRQYSLDGSFIGEFASLKDAGAKFGNATNIGMVCRGKQKTAYGYRWSYV